MKQLTEDNYIIIRSWMLTQLKLKSNRLIIYALIYSFGENGVHGGINYLKQWTGISKPSVQKALNRLLEKDLIEKTYIRKGSVNYCRYRIKNFTGKNSLPVKKLTSPGKETCPSNNIHNNNFNICDNILSPLPKTDNIYEQEIQAIVSYLNNRAGTAYRPKTKETRGLIKSRLREGYTVEDFKTVIDKKCRQWLGGDMAGYLRPSTLFGAKFESYLNAPVPKTKADQPPPSDWDKLLQQKTVDD